MSCPLFDRYSYTRRAFSLGTVLSVQSRGSFPTDTTMPGFRLRRKSFMSSREATTGSMTRTMSGGSPSAGISDTAMRARLYELTSTSGCLEAERPIMSI